MSNVIKHLKNRFYYSLESIKNRYPCKIVNVKSINDPQKIATILYQAATKLNIRESSPKEILDDPMLVEKFHPTDCIKLSFLAAGELLLKNTETLDEAKEIYRRITKEMFKELSIEEP